MLRLVFDSLRAPYDLANILQTAMSAGDCELYLCGNSIRHDHPKVLGKVWSWCNEHNADLGVPIRYYRALKECVGDLKRDSYLVVGTSPRATEPYTDLDYSKKVAVVFGTETSGLSATKIALMDRMVHIPMSSSLLRFMTLSVAVPIIVFNAKQHG